MGVGNMAIMYLVHRFPSEFLPAKYMNMSYNGLRAPAMLTIPFCLISGLYFSVSSTIAGSSTPLKGHLYGYTVSLSLGIGMIALRRVSWYYPLLGCMYLAFGGFHHYRRMMLYGDNAPIFNWSDFKELYAASKKKPETIE
ncbi:hypothetical protein AGDE_01762 [Angomonas deanei]|nr:hypothetical protein AGDE_01762 [Angomonas deanei]|eukprot:EPY42161.1 hypothetical protein AGDE_01762 [Angomonas deanei]